jgi:hypothetical protein
MTNIKTSDTWVLWPTKICPSFYDLAANQIISGKYNFILEFEFRINNVSQNTGERGTILSINPNYFVLHYYNEYLSAIHMTTNGGETHNIHQDLPYTIKIGQTHKLKIENIEFSDFFVYIDNKKVFSTNNFVETKDAQIFLGSETFPWSSNDLNSCDMDLFDFKLYHNNELVCHHDFNNIIHNKFVDLTNNCNFIHKL